jgi:hypothetical protein
MDHRRADRRFPRRLGDRRPPRPRLLRRNICPVEAGKAIVTGPRNERNKSAAHLSAARCLSFRRGAREYGQVRELSYLHSRDVTYATFCEGPYEESVRYRDFMGWDVPWYSAEDSGDDLLAGRSFAMLASYLRQGDRVFETYWTSGRGFEVIAPTYGLRDTTVYGRQESWEDSPAGSPQHWQRRSKEIFRTGGRPTAQWSRLEAARSDDLGAAR